MNSGGITTAGQRAALEKAGWVVTSHPLYQIWDCNLVQVVLTADGDCRVTDLFQHLSEPGVMMRLLEFAATIGIAPPGYVMVPVVEVEGCGVADGGRLLRLRTGSDRL